MLITELSYINSNMADMDKVKQTFDLYVVQGNSKATALSNKNFAKLCKDCKVLDGKKITNPDVDVNFVKFRTKGQQTINFDQFKKSMLEIGKKRYGEAKAAEIFNLVAGKAPLATGVTKTSKTGGVEKMTDTSQYTGMHGKRFDEDGKGLGISGREDIAENTGYVGNYGGAGSYDQKTK